MLSLVNKKVCSVLSICSAALLFQSRSVSAATIYKLDLTYSKIVNDRDLQMPDVEHKDWTTAVTFEAGVKAQRYYLEPTFAFESCYQKVCAVHLEFHQGIQIVPWLSIEHYHRSEHTADRPQASGSMTAYPLKDFIGFRVKFVQ